MSINIIDTLLALDDLRDRLAIDANDAAQLARETACAPLATAATDLLAAYQAVTTAIAHIEAFQATQHGAA